MEMTFSINNYFDFSKAFEFGKLELGNKVNEGNIDLPLEVNFFSSLLYQIPLIKNFYETRYIQELQESILILKGYKEIINTLQIDEVISEHAILDKQVPMFENLDILLQSLKTRKTTPNEQKIIFLFHELTNELRKIKEVLTLAVDFLNKLLDKMNDETIAKEFDEEMAAWDRLTDESIAEADLLLQ